MHLYDEQDEKVQVGDSQKLLQEIEGEERDDVVLGCCHNIVLKHKRTRRETPHKLLL